MSELVVVFGSSLASVRVFGIKFPHTLPLVVFLFILSLQVNKGDAAANDEAKKEDDKHDLPRVAGATLPNGHILVAWTNILRVEGQVGPLVEEGLDAEHLQINLNLAQVNAHARQAGVGLEQR